MKVLLTLVSFLAAGAAQAADPKVGDQSVLKGAIYVDEEMASEVTLTAEVVSVNNEARTAKVKIKLAYEEADGEEETQETSFDDLYVPDDVAALTTKCATLEGFVESITVPAGTFDVCTVKKVDEDTGAMATSSKGIVPLGLVRVSTELPVGKMDLELVSFQRGQ